MGLKIANIGLLLVISVLLTIEPSTCGSLENEKLAALSDRLDKLQTKVESLEDENEALKIRVDYLEKKDVENGAKLRGQEEEIIQLKAKMDSKLEFGQSNGPSSDGLVTDLRSFNEKMNSIYRIEDTSGGSSTRAVVPSSCDELFLIGHTLNGLYLVQNPDTKKVETVFCDFGNGSSIFQDFIGQVDVKTKSVHFYVQRNSSFSVEYAVIPFELARVNVGDAFDLASGVFTVPVPGIYHFDFSALKSSTTTNLYIFLQVNGVDVGLACSIQSATGSNDAVSLSASLRLAAGDKVNLYNYWRLSVIADSSNHQTHFSGWLVEEELM